MLTYAFRDRFMFICTDGCWFVISVCLFQPTEDSWDSATPVTITSELSFIWRGNCFQCVRVD